PAHIIAWPSRTVRNRTPGSVTTPATRIGRRGTCGSVAADAAPMRIITNARPSSGRLRRSTTAALAHDPAARPRMKTESIAPNAYVVGPIASASTRVHATSWASATKPVIATANAAAGGRVDAAGAA